MAEVENGGLGSEFPIPNADLRTFSSISTAQDLFLVKVKADGFLA